MCIIIILFEGNLYINLKENNVGIIIYLFTIEITRQHLIQNGGKKIGKTIKVIISWNLEGEKCKSLKMQQILKFRRE